MAPRITRQDVARHAGVSGATVSRVYNAPHLVDQATADRVRASAAALGFVPDPHAAALRRGGVRPLLFVEVERPGYHWPSQRAFQSLYGEIVRAVVHGAQHLPFPLRFVSLGSTDEVAGLADQGEVAGILGFDVADQALAEALAALGRPVVCAHHGDHLTGVSTVATDNRQGGRLQARHLGSLGRRRLAYVTGLADDLRSHRLRQEGFAEAAGTVRFVDGAAGYEPGIRAGRDLAEAVRSGAIDGIGCVNDLTALGVVRGLADGGLGVPGAVPVVGYDNLVLTGLVGPGLPTIDAQLPLVYTRALELLVDRIQRPGPEVHEVVAPVVIP